MLFYGTWFGLLVLRVEIAYSKIFFSVPYFVTGTMFLDLGFGHQEMFWLYSKRKVEIQLRFHSLDGL